MKPQPGPKLSAILAASNKNDLPERITTMKEPQRHYRAALRKFRMALLIGVHNPLESMPDPADRKEHLDFLASVADEWAEMLGNNRFGIDETKYIHCELCRDAVERAIKKTKH